MFFAAKDSIAGKMLLRDKGLILADSLRGKAFTVGRAWQQG